MRFQIQGLKNFVNILFISSHHSILDVFVILGGAIDLSLIRLVHTIFISEDIVQT